MFTKYKIYPLFLLKCLFQSRKVSGHVFVSLGIDFAAFYDFDIGIVPTVVFFVFHFILRVKTING